jgi:hypothetical protein
MPQGLMLAAAGQPDVFSIIFRSLLKPVRFIQRVFPQPAAL